MKRIVRIAVLVAVLGGAVSALALAASTSDPNDVTIGVRLTFADDGSAAGSFALCCAISDAGSARAQVTDWVPNGDEAHFKATNTLRGANGRIRLLLDGVTGPLSGAVHLARGSWKAVSGTGAYADVSGEGTFTAVTNEANGRLTGIDVGQLALGQ